jgi:hypothetical protein
VEVDGGVHRSRHAACFVSCGAHGIPQNLSPDPEVRKTRGSAKQARSQSTERQVARQPTARVHESSRARWLSVFPHGPESEESSSAHCAHVGLDAKS